MKFKSMQLIINSNNPTLQECKNVVSIGMSLVKDYGSDWYKIEKGIFDDRYLWLYVEHDNATRYNSKVIDGNSDQEIDNPRKITEVEMRNQFFACFDVLKQRFYISNYDKKGFIQYYLTESLQKEALLKNIYASIEEFQNSIKTLESIKFTQINTLFQTPESSFEKHYNILGFGLPEKLKMQAYYGNSKTDRIKEQLQALKKRYSSNEFEHIVIVGKDDNDIEQSFDFSSKLEKIEISPNKNEFGRYENAEVKRLFIDKLRSVYGKEA